MSTGRKFRVAIIGGGIGGLAFAISLAKCGADVDVDIYESAASFGEVGAGIAMWARMWNTMKILGLEDDLRRRVSTGERGQKFTYRKSDQAGGFQFGYSKADMFPYHRAEFLHVLLSHAPSHYGTHFGKRLESYEDSSSGPVILRFRDGTTAECDLLIGADGIKSTVRKAMYEELIRSTDNADDAVKLRRCTNPLWTGQVAYRGLVPREALEAVCPDHPSLDSPAKYMGKHRYLITYPISQGKLINCVANVAKPSLFGTTFDGPWTSSVTKEEMLADFHGWEPYATTMLNLIESPTRWVVHTMDILPTYVAGRVALVGDAAHAMTPHQGSGAGQAVEDGLLLATLLARDEAQRDNIQDALQVYDAVRRPFSQNVLNLSYKTGEMYCFESHPFEDLSAEESAAGKVSLSEAQTLSEDLGEILRWTWTTTIQTDLDSAVQQLVSRVHV